MKAQITRGGWDLDVAEVSDRMMDLSRGRWELYTHPEKGDTLTLFTGDQAILSLHNLDETDVRRNEIVEKVLSYLGSREMGIACLARIARLEHELQVAVKRIAQLESES